jgi:hypothetical protein
MPSSCLDAALISGRCGRLRANSNALRNRSGTARPLRRDSRSPDARLPRHAGQRILPYGDRPRRRRRWLQRPERRAGPARAGSKRLSSSACSFDVCGDFAMMPRYSQSLKKPPSVSALGDELGLNIDARPLDGPLSTSFRHSFSGRCSAHCRRPSSRSGGALGLPTLGLRALGMFTGLETPHAARLGPGRFLSGLILAPQAPGRGCRRSGRSLPRHAGFRRSAVRPPRMSSVSFPFVVPHCAVSRLMPTSAMSAACARSTSSLRWNRCAMVDHLAMARVRARSLFSTPGGMSATRFRVGGVRNTTGKPRTRRNL